MIKVYVLSILFAPPNTKRVLSQNSIVRSRTPPPVRESTAASEFLLGAWVLRTWNAQTVPVPEEHHTLRLSFCALGWLYPVTHACTGPNALQKANRTISSIGAIMTSHDGFDRLRSLVSVVEGDGRNVVVENMSFDNPMH